LGVPINFSKNCNSGLFGAKLTIVGFLYNFWTVSGIEMLLWNQIANKAVVLSLFFKHYGLVSMLSCPSENLEQVPLEVRGS